MAYRGIYNSWVENPYFDEKTREELIALKDNEKEIEDRFYKNLEFGTAGLRGVIAAGTNRINIYTVRRATFGLANYILKNTSKEQQSRGVVVAHDNRFMSREFCIEAANTLAACGIKAYIFDGLRTTPELSFALRHLGCIAGIVITASHNPAEYNGYKVYWEDGAQIVAPVDKEIMNEVKAVTDFSEIKDMTLEDAKKSGLYNEIGEEVDNAYIDELKKLVLNEDIIRKVQKDLKIVYTPLHGTGNLPVQRILKEIGFENVYVVPEQEKPDGNFSTVTYPNPEDKKAFALALDLAHKVDADIVLATDPDADRLGIYAKDTKTDEYMPFTGNMSALLIAEYELSQKKAKGILPKNGALITTIVSSNMAAAIAKEYGVKLIKVLTGFKYIGEQIKLFEKTKENEYVFGFEESYGCLIGTHARDKDAIVATMALCEAAAFYKSQGKTLWDAMIDMYERYGYYKDDIQSITLKGIEGLAKIQEILETLRKNPPAEIAGYKVLKARDYKADTIQDMQTGEVSSTGLPTSNVLYYDLSDDAWLCVRPSGTEPKVKFYYGIKGTSLSDADEKSAAMGKEVLAMIDKIM